VPPIDVNNPITRLVLRPSIDPAYDQLEQTLGIKFPLYIDNTVHDDINCIFHINVTYHRKALFTCSECSTDDLKVIHKRSRIFRGLDLINSKTHIHINLPILSCPNCGNITYIPAWLTKSSNLTLQLQNQILADSKVMSIPKIARHYGLTSSRISKVIKRFNEKNVKNDDFNDT
jgi:hypothetical protein